MKRIRASLTRKLGNSSRAFSCTSFRLLLSSFLLPFLAGNSERSIRYTLYIIELKPSSSCTYFSCFADHFPIMLVLTRRRRISIVFPVVWPSWNSHQEKNHTEILRFEIHKSFSRIYEYVVSYYVFIFNSDQFRRKLKKFFYYSILIETFVYLTGISNKRHHEHRRSITLLESRGMVPFGRQQSCQVQSSTLGQTLPLSG